VPKSPSGVNCPTGILNVPCQLPEMDVLFEESSLLQAKINKAESKSSYFIMIKFYLVLLKTYLVINIPLLSDLSPLLSTPLVTNINSQPSSDIALSLDVINASLAAIF